MGTSNTNRNDDSVMIIAEAGINHNGDLDLAMRLVDAAKAAGADVVKFQTGNASASITKYANTADYQKDSTGSDQQLAMIEQLELPLLPTSTSRIIAMKWESNLVRPFSIRKRQSSLCKISILGFARLRQGK